MTSTRCAGRLVEVGAPEGARVLVGRRAHHAGVAVAPGAAEEAVVGHAQRGAGPLQLDAAGTRRAGRPRPRRAAASAGTWISPSSPRVQVTRVTWAPVGGVARHRRAGADRLVVGVRVHEQDPTCGQVRGDGHPSHSTRGVACDDHWVEYAGAGRPHQGFRCRRAARRHGRAGTAPGWSSCARPGPRTRSTPVGLRRRHRHGAAASDPATARRGPASCAADARWRGSGWRHRSFATDPPGAGRVTLGGSLVDGRPGRRAVGRPPARSSTRGPTRPAAGSPTSADGALRVLDLATGRGLAAGRRAGQRRT